MAPLQHECHGGVCLFSIASGSTSGVRSRSTRRTRSSLVRLSMRVAAVAATVMLAASIQECNAQTSASTAPVARWGAASARNEALFLVHGGKTNGNTPGGGGYTYASGPNTKEVWSLDLSQSFATSNTPWRSVSLQDASSAPAVAFHSFTPLGNDQYLIFGGSPAADLASQAGNDSTYTVKLSGSSASFTRAPSSWAEPQRRMNFAADGDGDGRVWVVGGQSTSGSLASYDEAWTVKTNVADPSFRPSDAPIGGLMDGSLTMLDDDTLLSLGGIDANGTMQSFDTLAFYSTSAKRWSSVRASGTSPSVRRGHVAVSLPDKRVFVHGGTSIDQSTALGDAWMLDWSQAPPIWSQISSDGDSSSASMPSARFGHSAVAYGCKIALAFGWATNNPADATLYIFDATAMQSSNRVWSGGQWTTTYTPDPNAAQQGSNGNHQNSGNGSSGASDGNTSTPSSDDPFAAPTGAKDDPTDGNSDGSTGAGKRAGAVLGGLIGLGMLVGVGYYAYRRHAQNGPLNNWRHGEGDAELLGSSGGAAGVAAGLYTSKHYSGPDELYTLEKGMVEGGGGAAAGYGEYRPGMHPVGPREPTRTNLATATSSPWTLGNIGHAMEGSGPHLRQRLALLTGIGFGASQSQQQRFDMLADEIDDHEERAGVYAMKHRGSKTYDEVEEDDDLEAAAVGRQSADDKYGEDGDLDRHVRERSYGRVEQDDWDEYPSYGDIGATMRASQRDTSFTRSPFEDETISVGGGSSKDRKHSAGPGGAAALYDDYLDQDSQSYGATDEADSMTDGVGLGATYADGHSTSSQSHANASSSNQSAPTTVSKSGSSGLGHGAALNVVSFSDATAGGRNGGVGRRRSNTGGSGGVTEMQASNSAEGRSALIRRSPTWWDRFMGQNFLERSASGRLYTGPRAEEPIRDPTQPPPLDSIRETGHSADPSAADDGAGRNPFADGRFADGSAPPPLPIDELGRRLGYGEEAHNSRSLTSLHSARTVDTAVLEARMQTMDVQRAGTVSSRRTYSSGRNDRTGSGSMSSSGLSRHASLRDGSLGNTPTLPPMPQATPGSIVWDPTQFEREGHVPRTVYEQDETDASRDIVDVDDDDGERETERAGGKRRFAAHEEGDDTARRVAAATNKALHGVQQAAKTRQPSDAPSVTPSTTKRARQNPQLTEPLSPAPSKRARSPPLRGTVRDRAQAIERKWTNEGPDAVLPLPRSPAVSMVSAQSANSDSEQAAAAVRSSLAATSTTADASANTFVPSRGGKPILTRLTSPGKPGAPSILDDTDGGVMVTSPLVIKSAVSPTARFSHGLVPKAQLYVANPDDRRGSSTSSSSTRS